MTFSLEASYAECERLTRSQAGNFYYSFLVLPRAKQRAMSALYAFLRRTDDLSDSHEPVETRRAQLAEWRAALDAALAGEFRSPLLPALADTVTRYAIPVEHLRAAIDGVEQDLDPRVYHTFDELADYCHLVASAVGLACIHIWGFRGGEAIAPAKACGIAFQLTNILRDLKEDAARGRVYLPQENLERFDYTADDLLANVIDGRFRALMRFEMARAEEHYRRAAELERWLEPDGRRIFGAMTAIYHSLLDEIRRRDGDIFGPRVRLSAWRKLSIAAVWLVRESPLVAWGWPAARGGRANLAMRGER